MWALLLCWWLLAAAVFGLALCLLAVRCLSREVRSLGDAVRRAYQILYDAPELVSEGYGPEEVAALRDAAVDAYQTLRREVRRPDAWWREDVGGPRPGAAPGLRLVRDGEGEGRA